MTKSSQNLFSAAQKQLVVIICGLVTGMAFIDATALNVALPAIQLSLAANSADAFWVLEIYLLFLSALLLVGGALGDQWGRRRSLRFGVYAFALTSLACAAAQDAGQLIFFRAFQGIGAALMIPASLALINASFEPAERGLAIGSWSAVVTLSIPLGPLLGGLAVDYAFWQLIFLLNLPLSLVVLYLLKRIPRPPFEPEHPAPLDVTGSLLITFALGMIILAVLEAGRAGQFFAWHLFVLGAGFLCLAIFFWYETRTKTAMIPPSLMVKRQFQIVSVQTLFLFAGFQGSSLFINFMLIQSYGFSALLAGVVQLPISIMVFFLSRPAGRWVSRYGPRGILCAAGLIIAVGQFGVILYDGGAIWHLLMSMAILGIGVGLMAAPLTTVAMAAAEPGQDGIVSAVNNAISRIGPLLSVALFGYWQAVMFQPQLFEALTKLQAPAFITQYLEVHWRKMAAIAVPTDWPPYWQDTITTLIQTTYIDSVNAILWGCVSLSVLSGLIALFYRPTDAQQQSAEEEQAQ